MLLIGCCWGFFPPFQVPKNSFFQWPSVLAIITVYIGDATGGGGGGVEGGGDLLRGVWGTGFPDLGESQRRILYEADFFCSVNTEL